MSIDFSSPVAVQPRQRPNWLIAIVVLVSVVALFFITQILGVIVVMLYGAAQHWSAARIDSWLTTSIPAQFAFGVIADGLLIVAIGLLLKWLHWHWQNIGLTRPKPIHLLVGLLAIIPYLIVLFGSVYLVSYYVHGFNPNQKQQIGYTTAHGVTDLLLTFVGLVIIPALAEEIAMRGLLYTSLKRWLPTIVAGLVVSLLFGAAHLAEGGDSGPLWVGALDTFVLSLVLVFLREKTANLWAGVVLHAAKNSLAFTYLFFVK